MALTTALNVAEQVASALDAAHAAGIVHRDVKPENIMVRNDGVVKVLDFGLAKLINSQPGAHSSGSVTTGTKSIPGIVMGTVTYMSPEQAQGLQVDARTDIFSLGIVIYEMITGQLPYSARGFIGERIAQVRRSHRRTS